MQELIIKTKADYFSFKLREESDVYVKQLIFHNGDVDEEVMFRYSPRQAEIKRRHKLENISIEILPSLTHGIPEEKVIIIYTDDYDFKTKLTNWDFLENFETAHGINFSWEFKPEKYNTFEGYQDDIRRNKKYKTILINVSDIIEVSLNGVSLI